MIYAWDIIINSMIKLKPLLLLCALLSLALAQSPQQQTTPSNNFIKDNKTLISVLILLVLLTIAVYIDKRNGLRYITIIRLKAAQLLQRLRRLRQKNISKKEKLSGQENIPTGKEMHSNIFDSEKTYVEADIASINENIAPEKKMEEVISNLELEEDTPKVNLKEVFEQKEGQLSKRSKSKLRSKVQIKKSEILSESKSSKENEEFTDDNSFEVNNTEE